MWKPIEQSSNKRFGKQLTKAIIKHSETKDGTTTTAITTITISDAITITITTIDGTIVFVGWRDHVI